MSLWPQAEIGCSTRRPTRVAQLQAWAGCKSTTWNSQGLRSSPLWGSAPNHEPRTTNHPINTLVLDSYSAEMTLSANIEAQESNHV